MAVPGRSEVSTLDASLQKDIDTLYSAHHSWLYTWLCGKLGNAGDAADLAHDTFLRLMTSRRMPTSDEGAPRAFLTHVAKALMIDHWRRQTVESAFLETIAHLPESDVPSPEVRMLVLEALHRIDAMLRSLSRKTREIFLLAQLDGLLYQEIADRCDISLATVKRHMRQAFVACFAMDI
jgi:RNA polymerase sigma factor (sigma-70 family)